MEDQTRGGTLDSQSWKSFLGNSSPSECRYTQMDDAALPAVWKPSQLAPAHGCRFFLSPRRLFKGRQVCRSEVCDSVVLLREVKRTQFVCLGRFARLLRASCTSIYGVKPCAVTPPFPRRRSSQALSCFLFFFFSSSVFPGSHVCLRIHALQMQKAAAMEGSWGTRPEIFLLSPTVNKPEPASSIMDFCGGILLSRRTPPSH